MSCYIYNTRRTHFLYSLTHIPSGSNPGRGIRRHSSHVGIIVSGVLAGVSAISSTIVLLLYLRRRRRRRRSGLHQAPASDFSPHVTADEQEPRPNPLRESPPLPLLPDAHHLQGYAGLSTPQLVQILHARLQTGDNAEQLARIENPPRYED